MTENERVRIVREHLDKTQEQFGALLGVTKATISAVETGKNAVSDQLRRSIAREFNVSEDWLLTGEGDMFIQLDPEDELMEWAGKVLASEPDDFKRRLVKVLASLDEEQWKVLEAKFMEVAGITKED